MSAVQPRVVCAAIRSKTTGRILCGARHMDTVMQPFMLKRHRARLVRLPEWRFVEQGFIDQFGKFLTRRKAWNVAHKNGQIRDYHSALKGTLFSEDLY
jgi:hypothetical protein